MREYTDTVIIGGGQAGLAVSYYLTHQGRSHVVLEQSPRPAHAWRNQRWDSFTFVTPNWMTRLPGTEYHGPDPNAFMSRSEIVTGQSGCQIAEELNRAGRRVYLSVGSTARVPRRYRGKDIFWWLEEIGLSNRTVDQLKSPRNKFKSSPHLSGTGGGHSVGF